VIETSEMANTSAASESPLPAIGLCGLLIGLAILVAVGSFGSWASLHGTGILSLPRSASIQGTSRLAGGDCWITFSLAVLFAIGSVVALMKHSKVAYIVVASLSGSVILVAFVAMSDLPSWYTVPHLFAGSIGWGLWLCLVSAAIACIAATLRCLRLYKL